MNKVINQAEQTLSEQQSKIALTSTGKNLTGKQLAKKLASEKRKATNDAGKLLVSAMREKIQSLPIIRQLFKELEFLKDDKGNILKDDKGNNVPGEASIFCQLLAIETGKNISVDSALKIPIREYMDFITEIEASRQFMRGITISEFKDILTRYYRGERKNVVKLDSAANEILRQYTRFTDI